MPTFTSYKCPTVCLHADNDYEFSFAMLKSNTMKNVHKFNDLPTLLPPPAPSLSVLFYGVTVKFCSPKNLSCIETTEAPIKVERVLTPELFHTLSPLAEFHLFN